ncbi:molybdopterin-containing oxidoreductase family protein [Planctomycetes bacterium K23_9]|uniref:Polysulfide reductase chain A n=1 Tax=Stieleria marina TaxID=1930275 RepID=A0A517NMY6_9BACT|nr:Polysulfide reductase chain A precursor [Planctomycetes bacterium K23_9]
MSKDQTQESRRRFFALGAAIGASSLLAGLANGQDPKQSGSDKPKRIKQGIDLDKWNRIKATPYRGDMPGVCKLPGPHAKRNWPDRDKYKNVKKIPGMCQLCSTVCGIIGYVKDGRLIKVEGNPNDPNSRGYLCARGQAALNHQYHPERLLYPLKRVGKRGEGKWKRITWDEALDEIAVKLKAIRDSDHPEEFAFHQGRLRSKDAVKRFLVAFGTSTQLNHRALCSGNRRAANLTYLWESDWDLNDVEHTKYILNFGSNAFEAHQGHIPFASRIQKGRFENGAKLVTFDVRMSNTAGASDEWFSPFPGTDGAIALAMGHTILAENLHDVDFIETWTNVSVDELRELLKENTPEWAASVSGVAADDIRRIAIEFAKAAPRATTMCNRGSSAHLNGFYNDRAIGLLNALVGSVGKKGGWCWSPWSGVDPIAKTPPMPPSPKTHSVLEDPPEYPLANVWRRMRVGEIIYLYLLQGRAKLQAYMTYNLDSPITWPEESLTQQVMCDEKLIPFHVCINAFYNETAHYADIVLPWSTYLERWDLDARASYNLRPYVGLRTPMVKPLGESRDVRDFFPELAHRIGDGMEQWYPEKDVREYMEKWSENIPENPTTGKSGLDRLLDEGVWESELEPFYEPYEIQLSKEDLAGSQTDENGIITKDGIGIGIQHGDRAVRGFKTPSRKFEIRSAFVNRIGKNKDCSDLIARSGMTKTSNRPDSHAGHDSEIDEMPIWFLPVEMQNLADDELVMTSFKWNVHNHGRTMNLKWLAEIVHSNPAWLNPKTAERLGIQDGDWIEITSYHSVHLQEKAPHLRREDWKEGTTRHEVSKMRVPIVTMQGIHPSAIAMSNSCGHTQYTSVAQATKEPATAGALVGSDTETYHDDDWQRNMWWEDKSGGDTSKWKPNTGNGWNQNKLLPIAPDPISGQQAFHDTIVRITKIEVESA